MDEKREILQHMRDGDAGEETPTPEAAARRDVAAALRDLSHALSSSAASPEEHEALTQALRAHESVLATRRGPDERAMQAAVPGMQDFRDRSPIAGRSNPLAPPATLVTDLEAECVRGEVRFGPAFEGAPGIVHGGFVAAVLDEALGMACIFSGGPAMTAELTTRYRAHTPVDEPLRIEARLDRVEGRKVYTTGAVYRREDGEERAIVEASGLFIAVDVAKFAALAEAKRESSG